LEWWEDLERGAVEEVRERRVRCSEGVMEVRGE